MKIEYAEPRHSPTPRSDTICPPLVKTSSLFMIDTRIDHDVVWGNFQIHWNTYYGNNGYRVLRTHYLERTTLPKEPEKS